MDLHPVKIVERRRNGSKIMKYTHLYPQEREPTLPLAATKHDPIFSKLQPLIPRFSSVPSRATHTVL